MKTLLMKFSCWISEFNYLSKGGEGASGIMKVSIITCSWNSEPYISDCIKSVMDQSYPNIEHVFVDGGSEDGTLGRIKKLDGNVKWVTDVRGGISNAMNVGVEIATGDVIAHLHSDDYYLDSLVVEDIVNTFEATGSNWLFGKSKSDIDGNLIEPAWKMPEYTYSRLLRGNFIAHPTVFIRRDFFLLFKGFDCEYRYAMDYDFWLKLGKVSKPSYIDRWITAFRCHEESVSTANPLAALRDDFRVRRRHMETNPVSIACHYIRYWKRMYMSIANRLLK